MLYILSRLHYHTFSIGCTATSLQNVQCCTSLVGCTALSLRTTPYLPGRLSQIFPIGCTTPVLQAVHFIYGLHHTFPLGCTAPSLQAVPNLPFRLYTLPLWAVYNFFPIGCITLYLYGLYHTFPEGCTAPSLQAVSHFTYMGCTTPSLKAVPHLPYRPCQSFPLGCTLYLGRTTYFLQALLNLRCTAYCTTPSSQDLTNLLYTVRTGQCKAKL